MSKGVMEPSERGVHQASDDTGFAKAATHAAVTAALPGSRVGTKITIIYTYLHKKYTIGFKSYELFSLIIGYYRLIWKMFHRRDAEDAEADSAQFDRFFQKCAR